MATSMETAAAALAYALETGAAVHKESALVLYNDALDGGDPADLGDVDLSTPPAAPVSEVEQPLITEDEVSATPAAKAEAEERGVDLTQVVGSGVDGRVTKSDVEEADEGADEDES